MIGKTLPTNQSVFENAKHVNDTFASPSAVPNGTLGVPGAQTLPSLPVASPSSIDLIMPVYSAPQINQQLNTDAIDGLEILPIELGDSGFRQIGSQTKSYPNDITDKKHEDFKF